MITEDYVSFEIAILLKDKGFLKGVDLRMTQNLSFYDNIGLTHNLNKYYDSLIQDKIDFVVAPTHQMAMKWLREVHSLHIWIGHSADKVLSWYYEIHGISDGKVKHIGGIQCGSYEVACEAAILYCLKHLI